MSDLFDRAFEIVIASEGGYVDDPRDPGGKTRYGVTEAVARAAGYEGDMRALPIYLAKAIYRRDYWEPIKGDSLPWPLCLYVFDAAVNQGVRPAAMMLQRALDTAQDGIVGKQTVALAAKAKDWHLGRFMAFRAMRYQGTRNFDRFGEGWLTRIFQVAMEGAK